MKSDENDTRRFSFKFRILHTNVKGWHTGSRISWRKKERERAQTLGAPKGYVRPTHTYGLQRVGLAALINIRFLKYLPHPIDVLARPWAPPASIRHRTPPPLAERSSKARYSICIFKLESLYTHSHVRVCTRARPRVRTEESVLPPPSPFAITITTAAGVVLSVILSTLFFLPPLRPPLLTFPQVLPPPP